MPVVSKKKPATATSSSRKVHKPIAAGRGSRVKVEDLVHDEDERHEPDASANKLYIVASFEKSGRTALMADGTTLDLPRGSVIQTKDQHFHFIRSGPYYQDDVPGYQQSVLADKATLAAPKDNGVCLPSGARCWELELPAGTLLRCDTPLMTHKTLPHGGGHLRHAIKLNDKLYFDADDSVQLTKPLLLHEDLALTQDTTIPRELLLGGQLNVLCDTELPGKLNLCDRTNVDVVSGRRVMMSYQPRHKILENTVLLLGTLLPSGITLVAGTEIPAGTTLPAGMMIPGDTLLRSGTMLPEGLHLPGGTVVPNRLFRHIQLGNNIPDSRGSFGTNTAGNA